MRGATRPQRRNKRSVPFVLLPSLKIVEFGPAAQIRHRLPFLLVELHQFPPPGLDAVRGESEFRKDVGSLPGHAEAVHTDLGVGEAMPSVNRGSFHTERGDVPGQDGCLILGGLGQKGLLAGHGYHPDLESLFAVGEFGGGRDARPHLRPRPDQNEIQLGTIVALFRTVRHIGPLHGLINGAPFQPLHAAPTPAYERGRPPAFQGQFVRAAHLVPVGRSHHVEVGRRP
mmetsp:Transcript_37023/g.110874  ORF Transcript_37023/g.110874 Transcript_37023/m.110874 type:complete len:228 (-) Transcript_37023:1912-2595(-)